MALACQPSLVISDEPTTALDVTIQAEILDLLREMKSALNLSLLLITHDLGVIAETADRVAVMYAGRIVEQSDAPSLYRSPGHPYTAALLESLPRLDQKGETLNTIKGLPPSLLNIPPGCPFHPRCRRAEDICRSEVPRQIRLGLGRTSACHFAEEVVAK
jgi:oligopeptide transport system ATP-binding protein